jgi:Polysulphide reductase, NrfD
VSTNGEKGRGGEHRMVPPAEVRTYYDRPVLKPPVWKWPVPAYLFTGGLAGASSMLTLGAAVSGRPALARRARLVALGAVTASAGLLVEDLGRPSRFYNMLRVAKVTSPMSVGSWILAGFGPAAAAGVASDLTGVLPGAGRAADVAAGALGAALSTYTGVLVADTAVPVWHEARHHLPFLFAASAAASAGAVSAALSPTSESPPACRMAVAGALSELAMSEVMQRQLGDVGEPYRKGLAGSLSTMAKVLTGTGAAVMAVLGRRPWGRVAGGALIASGAAFTRFTVFEAGKESARDPKYVVSQQRRRLLDRKSSTDRGVAAASSSAATPVD